MATSSARDPSFPFYGSDFFESESVKMMTWEERGIYLALLWHAWVHGSIPADLELVRRIVGLNQEEMREKWKIIGRCWVQGEPGRLVNRRLEDVRAARARYRERRSAAGKAGNNARWGAVANGSQTDDPAIATTSPPFPLPLRDSTISRCTDSVPRDVKGSARARGGGEGGGKGTSVSLLLDLGYRSNSPTRMADIIAALKRFSGEGGTDADLRKLVLRAKTKGKNPAALLATWLDRGAWQGQLAKR